ncbi:ester cyclase [Nostoc muscorum FACHB-395]|uniref:ester cyclase n=1 Tax=Nostoc sp. KVJ20 TaxID=457944 RepID=UPI00083D2AB0|nr:ester cyclase [Nostoc sp. KVJ20]MBD2512209.1 ester cyclase [Desmonostoc muscorum FACHB-395]ODH02931.1 ester cyclase [Nostoc sp. KVJ20]
MLTEQNKALVLQFYKAFDDRKMEQALELLAPNFVAHLAGVPEPLDGAGFKQFGMSFYLAFGQGQHIFDEVIVSGDRVVTCGRFTATHLGEFQGLPPTGKQINLSIMHIDRVESGKIVEHWGQGDALGLMQQLGIVFLPAPKLLPYILKGVVSKLFRKA